MLSVIYCVVCIRPYRVSWDSMSPNLEHNTIILTNTLSPRLWFLQRWDIVVYTYKNETRVKRILGIGGEDITLKNTKVYRNDIPIPEHYLNPNIKTCAPWSCIDLTEKTYSVPEKSYFVLGDNRENSRDSRGCLDALSCDENAIYYVPQSNIIGKYILALPSF